MVLEYQVVSVVNSVRTILINNLKMLSEEQVKHVAKLARLELSDAEADTKDVVPTSQVTGLKNVSRKDEVKKWCEREELLAATELPVESAQIRVKPVITNN